MHTRILEPQPQQQIPWLGCRAGHGVAESASAWPCLVAASRLDHMLILYSPQPYTPLVKGEGVYKWERHWAPCFNRSRVSGFCLKGFSERLIDGWLSVSLEVSGPLFQTSLPKGALAN